MKNFELFAKDCRESYTPDIRKEVEAYFGGSMSLEEKTALACRMYLELPFRLLVSFHSFAFPDGKDVQPHADADKIGHGERSGQEVIKHVAEPDSAKRLEYFKGISIVFPHMLLSNYHRFLTEGEPHAKDFREFMDERMPRALESYGGRLEKAYADEDAAAKIDVYTDLAEKHIYELFEDYYNWMTK